MYKCRAVASRVVGGGRGEWDKSSLWMDLFSLDSILVIVRLAIIVCHFHIRGGFFRRHILWQVLKITFWILQIWKFFLGGTARRPYKARPFGTCDNAPPPPRYKRPSYGPEVKYGRQQVQPSVGNRMYCSFWISSILNLSIRGLFLKNSCSWTFT